MSRIWIKQTPRTVVAVVLLAWPLIGSAWPELASAGATEALREPSQPSEAEAFYVEQVDPAVQSNCLICHRVGGSAPGSGARLVLSDQPSDNHSAFVALLGHDGVDDEWILAKISGQQGHGGGQVAAVGSALFKAMEHYLGLLDANDGGLPLSDFWEGTFAEDRETTLRRASLLFSGKLASGPAIERAIASEQGLRQEILAAMSGQGFHDFIVTGANDKLLVDGLLNGIDFGISTRDRFPEFSKLLANLPDDLPEEYRDFHDKPFLTEGDADWTFRWAITREPLELIAHIVMADKPYTDVMTADYTMVNAFSDLAYRSEAGFDHQFADEKGFYDRSRYSEFRVGRNEGHIPHDQKFWFDEKRGVTSYSEYQSWPHSGVLSTQAWLNRYPSTDTNRNRARARWTYFHFLGVDIEKSAPRTTDPIALADTNNPTMNNSACTGCHERLDPVAGAYQSFGDKGHYLDQYGGKDSLSDAYKCPECYGGAVGSTDYREGDTWYRDMRVPGFEGRPASGQVDSLQWLGQQIAADPRFAEATVRFWWPSVFGSEVLGPPAGPDEPNYEQKVRAFSEQDAEIESLAGRFSSSGFSLKSLFADMAMSRWYRHSEVVSEQIATARSIELAFVGRGRLLTPEELDRKTLAIFGRTWRQWQEGPSAHDFTRETALTGHRAAFKGFYGGIDGAAVTARNRQLTPLMSNVTESMASDLACQIVIQDFNRPIEERLIFGDVDRDTVLGLIWRREIDLPGKVDARDQTRSHVLRGKFEHVGGLAKFRIEDQTRNAHQSIDGDHTWADITIRKVVVRRGNSLWSTFKGESIEYTRHFAADTWTDDEGNIRWRGEGQYGSGWHMHSGAWVEFATNLPADDYEVEFHLATMLPSNNVNEAMRARLVVLALDNIEVTASAQAIRRQIAKLYNNALSRHSTAAQLDELTERLTERANQARQDGGWFRGRNSHCDTWSIWQDQDQSDEERWNRYGDPDGMMRAWTMLTHGLLTSFGYLHD